MAKQTVKSIRTGARKTLRAPSSGTAAGVNADATAGINRAAEQRDRVEVDHALGTGAYDRIRAGKTARP